MSYLVGSGSREVIESARALVQSTSDVIEGLRQFEAVAEHRELDGTVAARKKMLKKGDRQLAEAPLAVDAFDSHSAYSRGNHQAKVLRLEIAEMQTTAVGVATSTCLRPVRRGVDVTQTFRRGSETRAGESRSFLVGGRQLPRPQSQRRTAPPGRDYSRCRAEPVRGNALRQTARLGFGSSPDQVACGDYVGTSEAAYCRSASSHSALRAIRCTPAGYVGEVTAPCLAHAAGRCEG
jgi:hypothetical protein